jgi:hypothetical protein
MRCSTGKALIAEWKQQRTAKQDTADIRKQIRTHRENCAECYLASLTALAAVVEMAMEENS